MNNLAFTSPYTALLWERFRYFIRYLPVLLFIAYIPSLLVLFIWRILNDVYTANELFGGLSFFWIITHFGLCSVLIGNNDIGKNSIYYPSERHYLLPVTSFTLTIIQALFSIVAIIIFWTIFNKINNYLFLGSPVFLSDYLPRASYLSLGITCYLVLIIAKVMCINLSAQAAEIVPIVLCTMWAFVGIYATDIFSHSIIAIAGIATIPFVSHISINKSRTISVKAIKVNSDSRSIEQYIQNKALPSPFRAQLWYEWKEWGKLGLILALGLNILSHFLYLPVLLHDFFVYKYSIEFDEQTIILSLMTCLVVGLWATYVRAKNNSNGNYNYNLPTNMRNMYACRYYISIFICLFSVAIPLVLAHSHDYFFSNSKLQLINATGIIVFMTCLCVILLSSPLICISVSIFYYILLDFQYNSYDDEFYYVALRLGVLLFIINTIFFIKYISKDMTQFMLFVSLLFGLSCSYFFITNFGNSILLILFILMTYFIGLHRFVRSRCR